VVIDGWDDDLTMFTYLDALNLEERGLLDSAKILCERCHKPITKANLGPDHREWVAAYPERYHVEGWYVNPFDLPDYHTPATIARKLIDYRSDVSKFRNYVLGLAHSDASNSIIDETVVSHTVLAPIPPDQAAATGVSGCIAGLDVGKTSWFVVGRLNYANAGVDILWAEQIRIGDDGEQLRKRVVELLNAYRVIRLCSDAYPYTPDILNIQSNRPMGWVLPVTYGLSDKRLPLYTVSEKEQSITAHRTKTLNALAQRVNGGRVRFPMVDEMRVVRKHLQGMKRVDRVEDNGEEISEWQGAGDDHYFHALNYLGIAADMIERDAVQGWAPLPRISQVMVGEKFLNDKVG
jgi:hypothetical protein